MKRTEIPKELLTSVSQHHGAADFTGPLPSSIPPLRSLLKATFGAAIVVGIGALLTSAGTQYARRNLAENWQGKNVMSPLAMEENRVRSAIYLAAIQKNAEEVQAGLRYKSRAADTTTPLSRGL